MFKQVDLLIQCHFVKGLLELRSSFDSKQEAVLDGGGHLGVVFVSPLESSVLLLKLDRLVVNVVLVEGQLFADIAVYHFFGHQLVQKALTVRLNASEGGDVVPDVLFFANTQVISYCNSFFQVAKLDAIE